MLHNYMSEFSLVKDECLPTKIKLNKIRKQKQKEYLNDLGTK